MNLHVDPVKFLLIDDIEDNLVALEALLRRDGLECLFARSGPEALELLLEQEVALAFIDVNMPGMDGYELAETIRSSPRTRDIPIIFVTAGTRTPERIFRGYEAGAVDYLFKPLDPRVLENKARTFFDLYRQKRELQAALELHETFVAIVSHDLRSPLNALVTGAELVSRSSDPTMAPIATRMRSSAQRMTRILDQLYDLARARLGNGIEIERKPTDLGRLAAAIAAEQDPSRARVEVHVQGDASGRFDEGRVGQVIANLVGNACRHSKGRVRVEVLGDAKSVVLAVHNDGVIPAEVRESLFERFRRGTERRREGLGLGLYIAHEIVVAHEGTISFQTDEERGTTFTVELPRDVH